MAKKPPKATKSVASEPSADLEEAAPAATGVPASVDKGAMKASFSDDFAHIRAQLTSLVTAPKLPRQLREAIEALNAAETAALHAIHHNE